jgi:hypothetical protein
LEVEGSRNVLGSAGWRGFAEAVSIDVAGEVGLIELAASLLPVTAWFIASMLACSTSTFRVMDVGCETGGITSSIGIGDQHRRWRMSSSDIGEAYESST